MLLFSPFAACQPWDTRCKALRFLYDILEITTLFLYSGEFLSINVDDGNSHPQISVKPSALFVSGPFGVSIGFQLLSSCHLLSCLPVPILYVAWTHFYLDLLCSFLLVYLSILGIQGPIYTPAYTT